MARLLTLSSFASLWACISDPVALLVDVSIKQLLYPTEMQLICLLLAPKYVAVEICRFLYDVSCLVMIL